jgi:hypothetical protein
MAAQWPTPGDRREDHAHAAGEAIGSLYDQAEQVIIAAIAGLSRKVASGSITAKAAARQLRATIAQVLSRAAPQARSVLEDAMTGAARHALPPTLPLPRLPQAKTLPFPATAEYTRPLAAALDTAADTAARVAEDTLTAITAATTKVTDAIPPVPPNPYAAALDRAFGKFAGFPGQSLSYRRLQAAQAMLDDLADHGITGFTDKAGRNWDLATYVEMATRTAVSNAWDDMQVGMAVRSGLDLVETFTTSTEGSCPFCIPWLGKTLSLTGKTPGYRTLAEAKASGFRHPNCRCSWVVKGGGYMADVTNPVPIEDAARAYESSQRQRGHEHTVRAAGRRLQAAVTPQAKARARRDLAAARAASAAHRQQHQLRIMQVTTKRREAPFGPR